MGTNIRQHVKDIYATDSDGFTTVTPELERLWQRITEIAPDHTAPETAGRLSIRTVELIYHCRKLSSLFGESFPKFKIHEFLPVKRDGGVRLNAEHCAAIRAYPGSLLKIEHHHDYLIVRRTKGHPDPKAKAG